MIYPFNSTIRRGCVGKSYPFEVSNGSHHELYTCSTGSNCNFKEIEYEHCYSMDYQLKNASNQIIKEIMCKIAHSPMGCYHFENISPNGEYVSKGCISDLYHAQSLQHFKNYPNFVKCIGSLCNSRPTLQKCLSCETNGTRNCASSDENIQSTICGNYHDECYTRITDKNHIERGCLLQSQIARGGCQFDKSRCATCADSKNCNDHNIKLEQCYVMEYSKDNALAITSEHSKPCPMALAPLGCYHFEISGKVIKKGCVADFPLEHTRLLTKDNLFKACLGDNCNSDVALERPKEKVAIDGLECIKCDSWTNNKCSDSPAETGTCNSPTNECYTFFYAGTKALSRGCVGENRPLALPEQTTQFFQKCSNHAKCNEHQVIAEQCFAAEYKSSETFEPIANKSVKCTQAIAPIGCYHFNDPGTGIIRKGCVSDLSEAVKTVYDEKPNFKTCYGDNCNIENVCLTCSSTETNDDCVSHLDAVERVTCATLSNSCVVGIDENGFTHRTCSEQNANEMKKFSSGHEYCNGMNCNDYIYPKHRLQCYHCEDCDLSDSTRNRSICTIYSDDDHCYTLRKGISSVDS